MRAVLALGGLALGTYFLYGGRMAQKEIEKGKTLKLLETF